MNKLLLALLALLFLISLTAVVFANSGETDYDKCVRASWPQCEQFSGTPQFDACLKPYTTKCQCQLLDKAWLKKYGVKCT